MSFNKFKETNEGSGESVEKPKEIKNQILEVPKTDQFEKKMKENEKDTKETDNKQENSKGSLFERAKEILSKNKEKPETQDTSKEVDENKKSKRDEFLDKYKAPDTQETKEYNKELGHLDDKKQSDTNEDDEDENQDIQFEKERSNDNQEKEIDDDELEL